MAPSDAPPKMQSTSALLGEVAALLLRVGSQRTRRPKTSAVIRPRQDPSNAALPSLSSPTRLRPAPRWPRRLHIPPCSQSGSPWRLALLHAPYRRAAQLPTCCISQPVVSPSPCQAQPCSHAPRRLAPWPLLLLTTVPPLRFYGATSHL
jgi:hypothetical protein